jgi:hypothetical protein
MEQKVLEQRPMPAHFKLHSKPHAHPEAVIEGEHFRFTILTPQLIRMEYSGQGCFEDRATQTVLNRSFAVPEFRLIDHGNRLEIITEYLHLSYDKQPFSRHGLSMRVSKSTVW